MVTCAESATTILRASDGSGRGSYGRIARTSIRASVLQMIWNRVMYAMTPTTLRMLQDSREIHLGGHADDCRAIYVFQGPFWNIESEQ